jgi:beta-lactamase regulating signal transducer with metallopeptidase domain
MIAIWMAYSLVLSLLVGFTALALERVADLARRPRRFAWAAAIAGSLLVPAALALGPRPPSPPSAISPALASEGAPASEGPVVATTSSRPAAAFARMSQGVRVLDSPLLLLWAGASLFLGFGLLRAAVRLRHHSRSWAATVVDGAPVLVAPDAGPAVVRISGLTVVLPEWALEADPPSRSLMLRHELEHCRARDPDLLLGATLALVAAPWNLALWWQVRRLQLAVETDCDSRVTRAGADPHLYGVLLLSVGARTASSTRLAATAFSETPSLLERRIKAMTSPRPRNPILRAAAAGATAVLIVAVAAMMPQPARPQSPRPAATGRREGTGQFAVLLRVRSTVPTKEIGFKAAYLVDDRAGLQFVETTTPFQVAGRTLAASAILQKLRGEGQLDAALIVGAGADTQVVSAGSGPQLVLHYQPQVVPVQLSVERPCHQRGWPDIRYLQSLALEYHPEALAPAVARDSEAIGLVFNSACEVVRDAVGRRVPGDRTVDDVLARLFPDLGTGPAHLAMSGGADAVASQEPGRPMIYFAVLK